MLPLPVSAVAMLGCPFMSGARLDQPLFPAVNGGFRDPANVRRELRVARGADISGLDPSHTFRKTAATMLDQATLSARLVADQLGHSRPSMTRTFTWVVVPWTPRPPRRWSGRCALPSRAVLSEPGHRERTRAVG